MTWGPNSSSNTAWRLLDSEKAEHAKTKAELARLRAALEHIVADGAPSGSEVICLPLTRSPVAISRYRSSTRILSMI